MSVYRITRFASPDISKAAEAVDSMRSELESAGADFIDIVSYGNGKGVVLAKYSSEAAMEAATEVSKNVFGKMVEQGIIDGDSIHPHTGVVISSV